MKPLFNLRPICLVVVYLLGGIFTQAASRPRYEVVDLGTLPGGSFPVQGISINNAGLLTAYARATNLYYRASVFENGALRDIGVGTNGSYPRRLNQVGQIIGHFDTDYDTITLGRDHAFLYSEGTVIDLSVQFGRYVAVGGLNNAGHIVGDAATDDNSQIVPFIYSNGVFQLIHRPEFQFADINDAGHILATSNYPSAGPEGVLSQATVFKNGRIVRVPLPRHTTWSIGWRINNRGHVIGYAEGEDQLRRGFVRKERRTHTVRPLPGDTVTFVNDLNKACDVVGNSDVPEDEPGHAILWRDGRTHDLNKMIPHNSGWVLHDAFGINDEGQIVGVGSFAGEYRGFLLNPRRGQHSE